MNEKSPLLKSVSRSFKYSNHELGASVEIGAPSVISYRDIDYSVSQRRIQTGWHCPRIVTESKPVLRGVSGVMKPGVNAIMGPSGAGKSTLLDILAKRRFPSSPNSLILLNGQPLPDNYNLISGYVIQDDILMGTLTVRESLHFSANLRLSSELTSGDRELRVNKLLSDLDLVQVADSKVGSPLEAEVGRGISGGERKRTQIGMELVPSPNVLYLDEPTSGLDAFIAAWVVKLLRRLGDEGKTVILSIHQPRYSIFQDFDTVTLLGRGETVYHGRASEAKQYFENLGCVCQEHENPPDAFLDFIQERTKISADVPQPEELSLAKRFKDSKHAAVAESELEKSGIYAVKVKSTHGSSSSAYASTFARQLFTLIVRVVRNLVRLGSALRAQIILSIFQALLVSSVYYQLNDDPTTAIQDRTGALFLIIMTVVFTNVPAVELFIAQRALFIHESANGFYRVSAYFLSRLVGEVLPLRVVPVMTMSFIAYWMIGFSSTASKYLFFMLNLMNTSFATASLALFSSSLTDSLTPATLYFSSIIIVMMIFGGLFVNLSTPPAILRWLKWTSLIRYSMEAFTVNELKDKVFCFYVNETCVMDERTATGNRYLEDQGFHHHDKWITQIVQFSVGIGVLFLTYLKLRALSRIS